MTPNHETIGDLDSPTLLMDQNPIHPPALQDQYLEIKPQFIPLVKQNKFHGLLQENPLDHVDAFEEICRTISSNGVHDDYLRC